MSERRNRESIKRTGVSFFIFLVAKEKNSLSLIIGNYP